MAPRGEGDHPVGPDVVVVTVLLAMIMSLMRNRRGRTLNGLTVARAAPAAGGSGFLRGR